MSFYKRVLDFLKRRLSDLNTRPVLKRIIFYGLVFVLVIGALTGGGLIFLNRKAKTAVAAEDVCNYTGVWGEHWNIASSTTLIGGVSYRSSARVRSGGRLIFNSDNAHLVLKDYFTVDGGGTVVAGDSLDPVAYNGKTVKITVCNGNFTLNGTINADGANNWYGNTGYEAFSEPSSGKEKLPLAGRVKGALYPNEQPGNGGGGAITVFGTANNTIVSGSGGGGNGGGGGGGQMGVLGEASVGVRTLSSGGGGAGFFGQPGPPNNNGGALASGLELGKWVWEATIAAMLTNSYDVSEDEPEKFLTTFGGRGGVAKAFDDSPWAGNDEIWNYGWEPDENERTKSAGGGFVKIMVQNGNVTFGGSISAKGTEGQAAKIQECGALGIGKNRLHFSTGGGAGGTVYIKANNVSNPRIDVSGGGNVGPAMEPFGGTDCFIGGSGGGGGGIIYFNIPTMPYSIIGLNPDDLKVEGGEAWSPGGRGRILYGPDIRGLTGAGAASVQITKETCGGGNYCFRGGLKTSTFNSGDWVYVSLTIIGPEALNGYQVEDEVPEGVTSVIERTEPPTTKSVTDGKVTWGLTTTESSYTIHYRFTMP